MFANITDEQTIIVTTMDMMFNIEMIAKDMKGGREYMTEKRYLLKYDEYDCANGEYIQIDSYFIDKKEEFIDADYFTIDGYPTMSDEQVLDLLNENEQLKSDNKKYIKGLDLAKATSQSWASVVRELREENCRLEKKNERLIKKIKRERASTTKQHLKWSDEAEEIINDLRKENEVLKEEIKDFQDLLSSKEEVLLKPMLMIDKKIEEGNRKDKRIKELEQEIDDIWRKYEDAHGISIRNTDWY